MRPEAFIKRLCISVGFVWFLSVVLMGCGDADNSAKSPESEWARINAVIEWQDVNESARNSKALTESPSGNICTDYSIETIYGTVYDDQNNELAAYDWPCSNRTATIDVLIGDVYIVIEGVVAGNILWRGTSSVITVTADSTTSITIEVNYIGNDTSAPEIINTYPATPTDPTDEVSDIPVDAVITATFNEALVEASVDDLTFILDNGNPVEGLISYDDGTYTATFEPDADLLPNTAYTATITTDVQNKAGLNLSADYSWTFTTAMLTIWPKLQYTIRDWTGDDVPDGYVGADPFLDIKPGTEDRAVLEYEVYTVRSDLDGANLEFLMGTLDGGGSAGTVYVYWFEANGFSDLDDWYPETDPALGGLLTSFSGPNTSGLQSYSIPVKDALATVRTKGRGFIGFLFLATGSDRYYIMNASHGGTPEQRAKLVIDQ